MNARLVCLTIIGKSTLSLKGELHRQNLLPCSLEPPTQILHICSTLGSLRHVTMRHRRSWSSFLLLASHSKQTPQTPFVLLAWTMKQVPSHIPSIKGSKRTVWVCHLLLPPIPSLSVCQSPVFKKPIRKVFSTLQRSGINENTGIGMHTREH